MKKIIIAVIGMIFVLGCVTAQNQSPSTQGTTIRIKSTPSGGLVLFGKSEGFVEKEAITIGETNLYRNVQLPQEGVTVRIYKKGYHEWNGRLSPKDPNIHAQLQAYSEAEKKTIGCNTLDLSKKINIIPVRVGIRQARAETLALDESEDSKNYVKAFMGEFKKTLAERTGCQVQAYLNSTLKTEISWHQIENQLKDIKTEIIGYTTVPIKLKFNEKIVEFISSMEGDVLLLRAEAFYLTGEQRFFKAAVPLTVMTGAALVGMNNPINTGGGTGIYFIPVIGTPPNENTIVVQMLLINPQTMELLWYGQVIMPDIYSRKTVTTDTAHYCAQQIPSRFFKNLAK